MTLHDHIRLIWSRPCIGGEILQDFVFDDGLPPPSEAELEATREQALALWQAEQDARQVIPPPVTRRQLKRWLHSRGLLESVPQLIAAIPDANARALAQIDWDEASVFEADNALVLSFAAAMGMTREQLHAAWVEAAQIL